MSVSLTRCTHCNAPIRDSYVYFFDGKDRENGIFCNEFCKEQHAENCTAQVEVHWQWKRNKNKTIVRAHKVKEYTEYLRNYGATNISTQMHFPEQPIKQSIIQNLYDN